jgi:hypothetical protein
MHKLSVQSGNEWLAQPRPPSFRPKLWMTEGHALANPYLTSRLNIELVKDLIDEFAE